MKRYIAARADEVVLAVDSSRLGGRAIAVGLEWDQVDVLVTDLDMPGMDGFALAEEVRKEARLAEMPIIALSAYGSPESIERGRKAGFHDFVAKFDRQSLIAALKEQVADLNQAA